jgi:hypothetical protein
MGVDFTDGANAMLFSAKIPFPFPYPKIPADGEPALSNHVTAFC